MSKSNAEANSVTNKCLSLENHILKVTVLPEFGGKICQLFHKVRNTYYLHRPEKDVHLIQKPRYGIEFAHPYDFGFDDCFPTISPSSYTFNGKRLQLPDHGELWSRSWEYETHNDSICLHITGEKLRYVFKKKIVLHENTLSIHYVLTNLEPVPFHYIWSSHPLLHIEPDDELILPNEIVEVFVNWSSNGKYGKYGDTVSWPWLGAETERIDFSRVQPRSLDFAMKFFTDRLEHGIAGLYRYESDSSLLFQFDPGELPYLGVWLCYGGWPQTRSRRAYTLALEPTSGRPDSLSDGIARNEVSLIYPGEEKSWTLSLSVRNGKYKI